MNKSRPIYSKLRFDASGTRHLVVTDAVELPQSACEDLAKFEGVETWVVRRAGAGIEAPAQGRTRAFRATAHLREHLAHRLAREAVGLRLYAVGMEGFLWDVMNIARGAGLGAGEVQLCQSGSLRRRVYCTHCRTMIEDVATSIVHCPGCDAALFVRDHFSRRLAAFMGVKVDAEQPGDIPVPETLYP